MEAANRELSQRGVSCGYGFTAQGWWDTIPARQNIHVGEEQWSGEHQPAYVVPLFHLNKRHHHASVSCKGGMGNVECMGHAAEVRGRTENQDIH